MTYQKFPLAASAEKPAAARERRVRARGGGRRGESASRYLSSLKISIKERA